jgi:demethylmenaquinone methyltransferase/2-methoxy-6-polyprenyl-1,4-benzoquinol methylase
MTTSDGGQSTFGFEKVSPEEKTRRVRQVFDSVANRYDVMNDLMSLGIHRLWKRLTIERAGIRPGERVLDLASGTGDLVAGLAPRAGNEGRVVACDINESMLRRGRNRLLDAGVAGNVDYVIADAERLPFALASFDCVTMAFGLRNVTHKEAALASIHGVIKPGGRLLVLEFSKPILPVIRTLYDAYSFNVLPALGRLVAGDEKSYRYLAESIRVHPDQTGLMTMMESAGFIRCDYINLSAGIVALHRGFKA